MVKHHWSQRLAALLVLVVFLAGATVASAQGFFYMEEEKDGRIYVFATAKAYDEWKKRGELGKSITRPGAGPKGETLVFESEDAINLYNFKHDLPGEVLIKAEEKKPKMQVSWKDGKTTIETDFAQLILSNRIQLRYTLQDDGDPARDTKGSFRIRRAKTKFEGWIYTKDLTYELQLNWTDTSNAPNAPGYLEDAALQYDFTKGSKMFMVKGGQFKVPFGRQELTSSGSQQLVDRSIVSNAFAFGRDIGLQLSGLPLGGKLDWRVGLFNGNGRTQTSNDNAKYEIDARLTWQPFGDVKYGEGDFESTDRPLFALAGQYQNNNFEEATAGDDPDRTTWGADAVFKYKGVSVFGEYFDRTADFESGSTVDSMGYNLQMGVFAIRNKLEFAGRYAALDPNTSSDSSDDDLKEYGLGGSWYFNKHNLKLQADARQLVFESRDPDIDTDTEYRLQMQFIF